MYCLNTKLTIDSLLNKMNISCSTLTANFGNKPHKKRLPSVEKVSAFWSLLEALLDELGCCENFFSSQPLDAAGCVKCTKVIPKVIPTPPPPPPKSGEHELGELLSWPEI